MLVRALLQTSLVLWLAQQTLQGGVKPQSVSWGRVLPARGVGVGVKPGVAGALGNGYGGKAMKTGLGRYPAAHLGAGGYRALGLGGRAGLKPGGYGTQGPYGASLGTGMGLGAGLPNGLGLGLGQGVKRGYGAGLGTVPGYGALAGIGYPGARPGFGLGYPTGQRAKEQKPADLGGPEMAGLGHAVQELKREMSRALGPSYGKSDRAPGHEMPSMRGTDLLGATAPELQAETDFRPALFPPDKEAKSLDPVGKLSNLGPMIPLDKQGKGPAISQAHVGEHYEPIVSERRGAASHGAALAAGGVRPQMPLDKDSIRHLGSASSQVQRARDYDSHKQQNQWAKNCGSTRDLTHVLGVNRHELLGSETQRLMPQPHAGKDGKLGLVARDKYGPGLRGSDAVENHSRGSLNLRVQGGRSYGPAIPGATGTQSLGITSVEGQESKGFTANGQEAKHLSHAEHQVAKSKALSIPGQTTSYMGGAGNYLGANLGAGGYGAGLGQGAYLGGAAGKLGAAAPLGQGGYPQSVAGVSAGYGDGATGYLGPMAGNGFGGDPGAKALSPGYGNGYSNGYGAGLDYPAELADVAEKKAGKRQAVGTGTYAAQVQGAYGALGAGLDSTAGKFGGGAAQVPYGNGPMIPGGPEGDGGYPYASQQHALGGEGAKAANKYGAGAGYGAQQTGYGAQLGATQDALGEQAGKYGGVKDAHGNGYKG